MNLPEIEKKWQKKWADTELYKFDKNSDKPKHYVLEMFSYPSGAKLHIGHWYNYSLSDSYARFRRMQGYNVFHPMGFDSFGLPAENYAIKTGIHPKDSTLKNIATMEKQLREMGATYDWDYEIATCMPEYYKWNQWFFIQLYNKGLAYRKNAPVNWCPQCQTVLANEQVVDGECERCHTEVVHKHMTQWFFKITDYAQELLDCLPQLDWPEKTKKIQTNWIGRSEGSQVAFYVEKDGKQLLDDDGNPLKLEVFTTRADTFMGVTYVVVAPESELCEKLTTAECKEAVDAYRLATSKVTDIDRMSTTREKTGVFTGAYAIHPLNGRKVPIWAADYVIAAYGTGVVMAVPSHDERDFEFATKYGLDIIRVVASEEGAEDTLPYCEKKGVLVNSGEFDGLEMHAAIDAIVAKLNSMGMGEKKVNYRLRDWLISRQRYWGTPIPMIHCPSCGVVPVPEKDLPVLLPYDVEFTPDGESPLAKCDSFINCKCPKCGADAKRDPDTMDTFVDSSWYQFRYVDPKNDNAIFDSSLVNKMCPVDKYVGGAEHAAMHLLYARFFTKAMRDMGLIDFDEPFTSLVHQGTILGPDGQKMSKSKGNTVAPDEYISKYGSDVFRTYLAFGFAYIDGGPWSDSGLQSILKFITRIERVVSDVKDIPSTDIASIELGKNEKDLNYVLNYTIKSATADIDRFQFNTSVARMMELLNAIGKYQQNTDCNPAMLRYTVEKLILILSPFAPHFAEEQWEIMGNSYSVFNQAWPSYDESALVKDTIEIAVQINGKVQFKVDIPSEADQAAVEEIVKSDPKLEGALAGRSIVKFIYVKGRLANIVAK
ncbi:MAG: leucine--tRNA ligase [Clostridiales bacterium]|nr:leucine--tRNA ligase [Clostridiales bacterium]